MKHLLPIFISFIIVACQQTRIPTGRENVKIFERTPINFGGEIGQDSSVVRLENGRIALKKVMLPEYEMGAEAHLEITLRSAGDRWDKSGSFFILTDTAKVSFLDLVEGKINYPEASTIEGGYQGVLLTDGYTPPIELMRFMTPFGVGFYSEEREDDHRKPVYIPKWEDKVVWVADITEHYQSLVTEVYVGVWIDAWTKEGYELSANINVIERPLQPKKTVPLVNTIAYAPGQKLPDFFSSTSLKLEFELDADVKNAYIHYITTGHGGHSGGDEFVPTANKLEFDGKQVLDSIPWRDDCASFRRFNPSSGVWLIGDTTTYINWEAEKYELKYIEERQASSDLSRSNWCPGSWVEPMEIELGDLKSGSHNIQISIPAQPANEDELNHWLVSAYLVYDDK